MREIVNSQTYQLSSRYNGTWQASYEPYFARKYVRRLWSEELYDAVAQSSGYQPAYTVVGFTDSGYAKPTYAMQLPDTTSPVSVIANSGDLNNMLNYFLRGNRDDQPRKQDGSILQALSLMNNPIVEMRTTVAAYGGEPDIAADLAEHEREQCQPDQHALPDDSVADAYHRRGEHRHYRTDYGNPQPGHSKPDVGAL